MEGTKKKLNNMLNSRVDKAGTKYDPLLGSCEENSKYSDPKRGRVYLELLKISYNVQNFFVPRSSSVDQLICKLLIFLL